MKMDINVCTFYLIPSTMRINSIYENMEVDYTCRKYCMSEKVGVSLIE